MPPAAMRPVPELRYASEETGRDYVETVMRGFHVDYVAEHWDLDRRLLEWDRSFGFAVGNRWVATCAAFSRTLTVPGASVPAAAVTVVTVAPAHRRQGLLTQMMAHQLRDVQHRREPVAILWASEAPIYGRFGYGSAVPRHILSGSTRSTAFLPSVDLGDGWVDEPAREEYAAAVPDLHARLLPDRPGALNRSEPWWERKLYDQPDAREGASGLRFALHRSAGGYVDGYAMFRIKSNWGNEGPAAELQVVELDADNGPARAALWRHLLDLDLVRTFELHDAPVDEPLRYLVADQRSVSTRLGDSIYVRLIDVRRALEARRYAADLDVVVELSDPLLPSNEGRFHIEAGPDGASVTKVRRGPDVVLDIRELG